MDFFAKTQAETPINKIALYSDMPENAALAQTVKAISGLRESFATDFIDIGAQIPGASLRHQAIYSQREGLWHLAKITDFSGVGNKDLAGLFRKEDIAKTDCFFDALYWCSEWQAAGTKIAASNDDTAWLHFRHWKDVAEEAGQALADNGVVMPCADGRILIDGYFRAGQSAIAAKTRDIALSMPGISRAEHKTGEMVKGEGIYLGVWRPKDRKGIDLKQAFDIYAAPQDLHTWYRRRLITTFEKAAKKTAGLKNWYGHDGAPFDGDEDVYDAIREREFNELGKWWIPTIDILCEAPDLLASRNMRAFKKTFWDKEFSNLYLSCSTTQNDSSRVLSCIFKRHEKETYQNTSLKKPNSDNVKDFHYGAIRLVRAVPRP